MHVFHDDNQTNEYSSGPVRSHPWTTSTSNPSHRYVDFKKRPDLIEDVLEDFVAVRHQPAVRQFYDFLRHTNRPEGLLETNDCAFRPPRPNDKKDGLWPESKLRSDGRLMLLFRSLVANTYDGYSQALHDAFFDVLKAFPSEKRVIVGLSYFPMNFPYLAGSPSGRELALHWWLWGDTESDVWDAFVDVCAALRTGINFVEKEIREQNPA